MDNYKFPIIAFGLCFLTCIPAFAFYSTVSPPSGASTVAKSLVYKAVAADTSFVNGIRVAANAAVNLGGRSVALPVAFRYAATAANVAARFSFGNPLLFAGVLAGSAAYEYYSDNKFEIENNKWVERFDGLTCLTGCYEYKISGTVWYRSPQAAFAAWLASANAGSMLYQLKEYLYNYAQVTVYYWPQSYTLKSISNAGQSTLNISKQAIPPYNDSRTELVTEDKFVTRMSSVPLPEDVPQLLPVPLPVETPIINPSPQTDTEPLAEPVSQPFTEPMGEPQAVPNTNPQQFKTPVIRILPSPTVDDPWQVDIQPTDILRTDNEPVIDPNTNAPKDDSVAKPSENTPGLCDLYPGILACAKPVFDTPDTGDLQKKDIDVSIIPQTGWGADNASCPAARHLSVANVDLPFTTICNFMTGIRPFVIAMAWISAAFILIGAKGGSS